MTSNNAGTKSNNATAGHVEIIVAHKYLCCFHFTQLFCNTLKTLTTVDKYPYSVYWEKVCLWDPKCMSGLDGQSYEWTVQLEQVRSSMYELSRWHKSDMACISLPVGTSGIQCVSDTQRVQVKTQWVSAVQLVH